MLRKYLLLLLLLLPVCGTLFSQEVRQDAAGKDIVVYPDGTWRYADTTPTTSDRTIDPRQRVLQLAETALVDAQRLEQEYRAAVRARAIAEADYTTAKVDPTGSKRAQEEAKAAFQSAKSLEAVTLERYEEARTNADLYTKAGDYPDKKLRKFLEKQGYPVAPAPDAAATAGTPEAEDPDKAAKAAAKARKKEEKLAAKAQRREAKLAEKARKEAGEAVVDTGEATKDDAEKAARKAAKRAAKAARKADEGTAATGEPAPEDDDAVQAARKAARQAAKAARKMDETTVDGSDDGSDDGKVAPMNNERPPRSTGTVNVRITAPEDYAQYAPETDVMLNPPGGDCKIVFDGEDSFSGKYRKETAPQLFFAYTPKQLQAYITDRDYVTAYGSIIRIAGGLQILVLDLYVAAENADRAFGTIPRNAQLNIKTLDGDNVLLLNGKTVRGRWDEKAQYTHYRAQYIVDKDYENQLTGSEVDQIRMVWETGYDDIPIYELDFFKDMFRCLNEG